MNYELLPDFHSDSQLIKIIELKENNIRLNVQIIIKRISLVAY